MNGLQRALPPMEGNRFEIVFLLKQANAALEPLVDVDNFPVLHASCQFVPANVRSHPGHFNAI